MLTNQNTSKSNCFTSSFLLLIMVFYHTFSVGQTEGLSSQTASSVTESKQLSYPKSNLFIDSTLQFDLFDLSNYENLIVNSILKVKLNFGREGQMHDTIIQLNVKDLDDRNQNSKNILLPNFELGIMEAAIEGISLHYSKLQKKSTLEASLIYSPLAYMHSHAMKIRLEDEGIQNSALVLSLSYEKLPLDDERVVKVNLNELELAHDSLFEVKLNYDRLGDIEDSLMIINLSQVALVKDSIDEHLYYTKIIDYAKNDQVEVKLNYKGYQPISKTIDSRNLFSLYKETYIFPLNTAKTLSQAELEERRKKSFVFVGSIFEEQTKHRLPNVRVIIRDRNDHEKQFVELTDAFGSFKDTVYGYKLDSLLSFDIFLKKEGYIPKFVDFEEVLKEYGEVDLEAYLKKINLTKAAVGVEIGRAANLNPIYFDLDRSNIRKDAARELDKLVEVMNDLPNISIELSSHTDSRATDRYNLALSQRRANSTTNYLISKGIKPSRIVAVGYGETQLVNECANGVDCPEEKHALNRRTEFEITALGTQNKKESIAEINEADNSTKRENPQGTVTSTKDENIKAITGSSLAEKEKRKRFSQTKTINVFCTITDAESGKPITGVEVIASDILDDRNVYTTKSNVNGEFTLRIDDYQMGDKVYLDFLLSKEGYISKTYDYRGKITEDFNSFININKFFEDIYLVAADLDVDIRKAANVATIEFELDQAKISRNSAIELDKIAAILVEQPTFDIEIRAHTDSRGEDEYNLKLSQERAESTMNYLVSHGVSYSRITAKGFGEQKLLNGCDDGVECSEQEHQENRRTEFIIK